jgi:hypothetical protein
MKRRAIVMGRTFGLAAFGLLFAGVAQAHHSFAMYDVAREVTVDGTVVDFQWSNPHSWVQIVSKDASGKELEWSIEGASPNNLARFGWTRRSIKAGDKIEAIIHPLKSGEAGGSLIKVTVNGQVIGASLPN